MWVRVYAGRLPFQKQKIKGKEETEKGRAWGARKGKGRGRPCRVLLPRLGLLTTPPRGWRSFGETLERTGVPRHFHVQLAHQTASESRTRRLDRATFNLCHHRPRTVPPGRRKPDTGVTADGSSSGQHLKKSSLVGDSLFSVFYLFLKHFSMSCH